MGTVLSICQNYLNVMLLYDLAKDKVDMGLYNLICPRHIRNAEGARTF